MAINISATYSDYTGLFQRYKLTAGNENATDSMFSAFLGINSPERTIFLDNFCNYTTRQVGNTVILIFTLKE